MKYMNKKVVGAIKFRADNFDEVCNFLGYTPQFMINKERDLLKDYSLPVYSSIMVKHRYGTIECLLGNYIVKTEDNVTVMTPAQFMKLIN